MKHNVAGPIADLAGAADALLPPRTARALFWRPRLLQSAAWTIHLPFAFWLVETCRPRRIVELGLGRGVSYFGLCQAVDKLGLESRCVGVDHWQGDRFTRADPEAGAAAARVNAQLYQDFSELVTADLVGAESRFPDASIDLLHVDVALTPPVIDSLTLGWTRKLSPRAVVLLHGTQRRADEPAAAAFLARLRARWPCFESEDGEGLTLALIGPDQPERLVRLAGLEPGSPEAGAARLIFHRLGRGHELEAASRGEAARREALEGARAGAEAEAAALRAELDLHRAALAAQTRSAAEAQARLFDRDAEQAEREAALAEARAESLRRIAELEAGAEAGRDREAAAAVAATEREAGLAEAHEALAAARRRIAELEAGAEAGRDREAVAAAAATEREAGLAEAHEALAAARRRIAEIEAEAQAGRDREAAAAVAATEREAGLAEAHEALAAARRRIAELEASREAAEARTAELEAGLAEARETLAAGRRRIVEIEDGAAATAAALAARFAELAALGGLAERARAEAEAAERRSRRDAEAARADRAALTRLQAEFARLHAYGRDLERRHAAVLASESWRAMAPVRRLSRLVGRGKAPAAFAPQLDRIPPHRAAAPTAAAPIPAPAPAPAPAAEAEAGGVDARARVARAFDKARTGFSAAGRARLAALAARPDLDAASRRQAARALVLLDAEAPDPATRAAALAALEAIPVWRTERRGPGEAATLRLALLEGLGRRDEAAALAAAPPAGGAEHPDFLLLAAGLAEPGARITPVARAFWRAGKLAVGRADPAAPAGIDNLRGGKSLKTTTDPMKISVIMPAWNAADTIRASLRSLTAQTWGNLEILVVDDASADGTAEVVAGMAAADPRIALIRLEANGGAYAARNAGLAAATGALVTCQDADDWSHPDRLRRQAEQLRANPQLVANASHWARATPDLRFERRPFSARVIHFNASSIMFRREAVLARAGFWDSVRFGADAEFWRRLQALFGAEAVAELPELLAIGRIREGSLSRAPASAYAGANTGARRAYELAWRNWHAAADPAALRLPFPPEKRPFGVPGILVSGRPTTGHFEAVLVSDFRHVGGTTASNVQELAAQARAGVKTALVQVDRYDFDVARGLHPDVQALLDAGAVTQLVHGDDVTADVAVVRFPPIFSHSQDFLPRVRPRAVRVVVNQPPRRVAGEPPFWSIAACRANIAAWLGQPGDWVPIGPAVRAALAADGEADALAPEDWFNVIDVDAWRVARPGWVADRPVIGRHGRDAPEKWLTRKADLLAAYPADGSVKVRVMGGAEVAQRTLGKRPAAWEVLPFNAMPARDFLAGIDFFVFFPHEDRIEAFGRTAIEAMAAGALAILPPAFAPLFGPAAVYCAPAEVGATVARFYADRDAWLAQTARAEAEVRARFGYERHIARLRAAMTQAPARPGLIPAAAAAGSAVDPGGGSGTPDRHPWTR